MAKKVNKINDAFIACINDEITFKELLEVCMPYFEKIASKNEDPKEAISMMSIGLYKLLDKYDESKGKPIALIRTMATNKSFDAHRTFTKSDKLVVDSQIMPMEECYFFDYEFDINLTEAIEETIEKTDLTSYQCECLLNGHYPENFDKSEMRLEQFRSNLLENDTIRNWYDNR